MVNPGLEPEALAGLFDYSQARVAVVDADVLPRFEEATDIAAWRPGLLVVGDGEHPHLRFEEEQQKVGAGLETAPTHRDDPAIWLFSGGTTGRPKAVIQTHTSFANTTECYAKTALGYGEDDITLSVPKLFFGYATGSNLFFPFSVGASAVLYPEHPTAEVVFEKIRRHRPTILVNVPTMINRMVQHPDASSQDLSSLRFATSAGEPLPAPLYRSWRETFGVELLDGLGTAEMWHIFISNLPNEVRPGTLGRPVWGVSGSGATRWPSATGRTRARPPRPSRVSGLSVVIWCSETRTAISPTAVAPTMCSRWAASGWCPRKSKAVS
jgi:acyl-coenzyme A synthetase/AMP-(fatty) acid ligase